MKIEMKRNLSIILMVICTIGVLVTAFAFLIIKYTHPDMMGTQIILDHLWLLLALVIFLLGGLYYGWKVDQ